MGNLFQQIKDSVKGQKSDFCSRATSVTLLESGNKEIPFNLVVNYTDCDKKPKTVNYQEVVMNGNYIPDCVQGGSPISITDGGGIEIPKQPMDSKQTSYKSFVQYGTTNCETPPSFFSYTVGDKSYNNQIDACTSGEKTITVYSNTNDPIVESTFFYINPQLTRPYDSKGFVYYSGKGVYAISTGSDGKLTSLTPCAA